ncbi:MAG TPA: hypothetical protein VLG92_03585 [Candidatus Saccharimonadia bacterium]|nr:hypothetical protein [Candidatus Saccharimonadia bacterium]
MAFASSAEWHPGGRTGDVAECARQRAWPGGAGQQAPGRDSGIIVGGARISVDAGFRQTSVRYRTHNMAVVCLRPKAGAGIDEPADSRNALRGCEHGHGSHGAARSCPMPVSPAEAGAKAWAKQAVRSDRESRGRECSAGTGQPD